MRIDEYIAGRRYSLKPATLKTHRYALQTFSKIVGCEDREPTIDDVRKFLIEFPKHGLKHTTVSITYCSAVKQYFKLFHPDMVDSVVRVFEMQKPSTTTSDFRSSYLSEKDIKRIISKLKPPHNLITAISYTYCRRLGEVLDLEKKDISDNSITFSIKKKKKAMKVEMPLDLLPGSWREELSNQVHSGNGSRVFPISARAVEIAFRKASGGKAKFHDVRHARIRHLLDSGVDPSVVKDRFSFHEHMSTLMDIYGRLKPEYSVDLTAYAPTALEK